MVDEIPTNINMSKETPEVKHSTRMVEAFSGLNGCILECWTHQWQKAGGQAASKDLRVRILDAKLRSVPLSCR